MGGSFGRLYERDEHGWHGTVDFSPLTLPAHFREVDFMPAEAAAICDHENRGHITKNYQNRK